MSSMGGANNRDTDTAATRYRAVRLALSEAWWHAKGTVYWLYAAMTGGRP